MALTLPIEVVADTMRVLVRQLAAATETPRLQELKKQYVAVLNTMQAVTFECSDKPVLLFEPTDAMTQILVASMGVTSQEVTEENFVMNNWQRAQAKQLVNDAENLLKVTDKDAYEYTNLLIQAIFFCNAKSGGGSLVQNIGLVWFSPKKHWSVSDVVENLYHESLHQALFIEDMVHRLFGDEAVLSDERYLVTSNFLHVKRPFDLAFHGVFVSSELVHFYEKQGNTTKVLSFLPKLKRAIAEMDNALLCAKKDNVELLTNRGRLLYDSLRTYIAAFD